MLREEENNIDETSSDGEMSAADATPLLKPVEKVHLLRINESA